MDFWVTIATILPILGLPLVLLARVHVAQALDVPLFARLTAGLYALTLLAIYVMEAEAVRQLGDSNDVPGAEWLQEAAIAIVWLAGGALIFSPGYLLLRIAFAGPGLGFKVLYHVLAFRLRIWWDSRKDWANRIALWRDIDRIQRQASTNGERWLEEWDKGVAAGLLVYGPDSKNAEARAKFVRMESVRQRIVSNMAQTEVNIWRINYLFDRKNKGSALYRGQLQQRLRRAREANLNAVWQVFDDWTAAQHQRQARARGSRTIGHRDRSDVGH